jgi:hypothetical protein
LVADVQLGYVRAAETVRAPQPSPALSAHFITAAFQPQTGCKHGASRRFADGRLLHRGAPSIWKMQDLNDTGRTGTYPRPVIR